MSDTTEQPAAPENADELAALAAEAADMEPEAAPGQPGEAAPDEEPQFSNQQALEMLLGPAFAVLAPNWGVQQAEITELAKAYGQVADKYFPEGMSIGVELNAAIITLAIIGPRMAIPRSDAAAEKAQRKRAEREAAKNGKAAGEAARVAAEKPDADSAPDIDLSAASDDAENTPGRNTDAA